MSNDRVYGSVTFSCDRDGCDEVLETGEHDFFEAIAEKKREGWTSEKRNSQWNDVCPACSRALDFDVID